VGTALFLLSLPLLLVAAMQPPLPEGRGAAPGPAVLEAGCGEPGAEAGPEELVGGGGRILRLVGRVLWSLFRLRRGVSVPRAVRAPLLAGLVDHLLPGDLHIPLFF